MFHRPLARAMIAAVIVLAGAVAQAGPQHRFAAKASHQRSDRECMARAMYFESDRTAEDGMLAVGTVVLNRLKSGRYGSTVCSVVGQGRQFAPGVLRRAMTEGDVAENARRVADAVLGGERHPVAGDAMFFHTANVPFRHTDKQYVLVSGGNAFYRWNEDGGARDKAGSLASALASAPADRKAAEPIVAAALDPRSATSARVQAPVEVATIPSEAAPAAPVQVAAVEPAPAPAAPVQAEAVQVAAVEAESPQEIAQAMAPRAKTFGLALAYAGAVANTPAAESALAVVAALKPTAGRRVISPGAPVLAAAGPVSRRAKPVPAMAQAPSSPNAAANRAVAAAWAALVALRP